MVSKSNGGGESPTVGASEEGKQLLENAYQLDSPQDNLAYYNKLASDYDAHFVDGLGYSLPALVVSRFKDLSKPDDTPIADIGCGTGSIGEMLAGNPRKTLGEFDSESNDESDVEPNREIANSSIIQIDGLDISPGMLAIAEGKKLYRNLYELDLTNDASVNKIPNSYGAYLSSGTFTHGHLGPNILFKLVDVAKRGALFVISVNKKHFAEQGFDEVFSRANADGLVTEYSQTEVFIYSGHSHEHSNDKGFIVSFRKS